MPLLVLALGPSAVAECATWLQAECGANGSQVPGAQGLPLPSSSALVVEITHFSPVGPGSGCGRLNLEGVLLAFRGRESLRINSSFSILLGFLTTISTCLPKLQAQRVFAGSQLCLGWGRTGFVPDIWLSLICSLPLDYSGLVV